jgi:hypothetical protein
LFEPLQNLSVRHNFQFIRICKVQKKYDVFLSPNPCEKEFMKKGVIRELLVTADGKSSGQRDDGAGEQHSQSR